MSLSSGRFSGWPPLSEIPELLRAINGAPLDAALHRRIGLVFWKEGQLVEALIAFRKVARINHANREAPFAMAGISIDRGFHPKAFEFLFDVACPEALVNPTGDVIDWKKLEYNSHDFPSPYNRAEWREIYLDAEKRTKTNTQYRESRLKEGVLCIEQKCYEKAIRIFTRLAVLEPRSPIIRLHRAMALSARRKDAEAEKEFSEAIMLQPKNPEAYKGLALIRARRGDDDKARSAFEQVIKLDPTDEVAREWLQKAS